MTTIEPRPAPASRAVNTSAPIPTLHVIASPGLGGAEIAYQRTVEALNQAGHATTCVLRRKARLVDVLSGRLPLRSEPMRSYWDLGSVLRLRALLKQGQWPIVQTWATRATWLTRAPAGVLHVARIGGFYRLSRFRHADGWIVNTPSLRQWLLDEGFPAQRIAHIDNFVPDLPAGLPQTLSRARLGIADDALLLISSGRLIEAKGFQDLLGAMATLPAAYAGRPLHLLLLGDGPYRQSLEAQAAQLGITRRVHFAGWVEHAVAALSLGDLLVLPSHKEALGNVILEAWSRGLPAVSTETAGGQYLIRDAENGLLAPIADARALAAVLDRVLDHQGLRQKLADEGQRCFRDRFSQHSTVAAYEDFYRRLIALGSQRRR